MNNSIAPLIPIAQQGIAFTGLDGQAFVRLAVPSGGFYILPVRSPDYRDWFFFQFFSHYQTVPTVNAFNAILHHLEAQANQCADRQRLAIFRRVGSRGVAYLPTQILLDLADEDRRFVEISPGSWKVTAGENALLQNSRSAFPLPVPKLDSRPPEHALGILRSCLNLRSRNDWLRCLAWLLSALRPVGPFPFLIFQGPPSSGKSTAARILRSLIDPCASPLFRMPPYVRDLLGLARHNWILAFDHVSALSPPLADTLCRLSSGLGAAAPGTSRTSPEPLMQFFQRPVLLTVTERWSCPPDLAGRALTVNFPPLSPDCRRTENSMLSAFNDARPSILGALCTAVGTALAAPKPLPSPLPSACADALVWAMAASPALGCTREEMQQAFAPPPPPHPMVEAVRALIEQRSRWTGSATELLELLQPALSCRTPKGLSEQLRSSTLVLADSGIELIFRRLHEGARIIELRKDSGDAPREKTPPGASPDFDPSPQPTETEALTP